MRISLLILILGFCQLTWAFEKDPVTNNLREKFWNASSATAVDLNYGVKWDCRSFYLFDKSVQKISLTFQPYDGLIQIKGELFNAYLDGTGTWGDLWLDSQYATFTDSGFRPNELAMQNRYQTIPEQRLKPAAFDRNYAFRVNSNGDLLVEYSIKKISGSIQDLENRPHSVAAIDYLASEYWICPNLVSEM